MNLLIVAELSLSYNRYQLYTSTSVAELTLHLPLVAANYSYA